MCTHGTIDVPISCALVSLVEEVTQKATERETWTTMQKSSHETVDLEASHPIICGAKTREQSSNAFVLLTPSHLVHPYFGWPFLPQWTPLRDALLPAALISLSQQTNFELSAKETVSSLNCCCWILDHSTENKTKTVSRQQDEEVWKKMVFYYHGWLWTTGKGQGMPWAFSIVGGPSNT